MNSIKTIILIIILALLPYSVAPQQKFTCHQDNLGGQCVAYVRRNFWRDYDLMPSLCDVDRDCGAYHAWDTWDFGFGKTSVPRVASIMILDQSDDSPFGHMGIVVSVEYNDDGTVALVVNESNWDDDERLDCGVVYMLDGGRVLRDDDDVWLSVRGFINTMAVRKYEPD